MIQTIEVPAIKLPLSELIAETVNHFTIKKHKPVMFVGRPGVGKSAVATLIKTIGKFVEMLILHPVVDEPTDWKGLPFGSTQGKSTFACFLPFPNMQKMLTATKPLLVLIDDFGQAPKSVQAAIMQVLLAREINGQKISDHVRFLICTNRREDKAGVTQILEPVKNRVAIFAFDITAAEWREWARQPENEIPFQFIAFSRFKPEYWEKWQPVADIENTPTPRSITFAGEVFESTRPQNRQAVVQAWTGKDFAREFIAFCKLFDNLPDFDDIIKNPTTARIPDEDKIDVMCVIGSVIEREITMKTADAFITYIGRMPQEFQVKFIWEIAKLKPQIQNTKAYGDWFIKNQSVLITNGFEVTKN